MVFSFINTFIQKIFATCHLLIIWLDQQTDAFINSGALERSLVICLSDEQVRLDTSRVSDQIDFVHRLASRRKISSVDRCVERRADRSVDNKIVRR